MDDVATAHSENSNLRKIQQKLLQWEKKDCSLSQLTAFQIEMIDKLSDRMQLTCTTASDEVMKKKQIVKIDSQTKNNYITFVAGEGKFGCQHCRK